MKFTGTIKYISEVKNGTKSDGTTWRSVEAELVYRQNEGRENSVLFSVMNDRINEMRLEVGKKYEVSLDFSVREYNGRRYLSASGWSARIIE